MPARSRVSKGKRGQGRETHRRDSSRVDLNRRTDSPERRVLLLIVLDVRQRLTPSRHEHLKMRRHERRAYNRQPTNRDRRVLRQTPRRLGAEKNGHKSLHQRVCVLLHLGTGLKGDLARRPGSVVAHRDFGKSRFDLDVGDEDGHELGEEGFEDGEAGDGRVAEEGVRRLSNRSVGVLQAEGEEGEDGRVGCRVEVGDGGVETLGEAREEVEGDDEEGLVRLVVVEGILLVLLELDEGLLDDLDAASEDGLGVAGETLTDGDDDGRHTLRREIAVSTFGGRMEERKGGRTSSRGMRSGSESPSVLHF
jgi:hypothetical protein